MADLTVPVAMLAFLAQLGCHPSLDIHVVDIKERFGLTTQGLFNYETREVFIDQRVANSESVLVHELWHSCQPKPRYTKEWMLNEMEASQIEELWMGGRFNRNSGVTRPPHTYGDKP